MSNTKMFLIVFAVVIIQGGYCDLHNQDHVNQDNENENHENQSYENQSYENQNYENQNHENQNRGNQGTGNQNSKIDAEDCAKQIDNKVKEAAMYINSKVSVIQTEINSTESIFKLNASMLLANAEIEIEKSLLENVVRVQKEVVAAAGHPQNKNASSCIPNNPSSGPGAGYEAAIIHVQECYNSTLLNLPRIYDESVIQVATKREELAKMENEQLVKCEKLYFGRKEASCLKDCEVQADRIRTEAATQFEKLKADYQMKLDSASAELEKCLEVQTTAFIKQDAAIYDRIKNCIDQIVSGP